MHGIIHLELQKFVIANHGEQAWHELLRRADLAGEIVTPLKVYPDEQIVRLVKGASELTGIPIADLLEAFGEALVPTYLTLYGALIKPEWRTLDVIEHTEETIHRVVRLRQPGAQPPRLRARRTTPVEVILTYDSPRRLCAVARGIARGLASHFSERISIDESSCMHRGDPSCVIKFQRAI
jgi:hypothetical protein